MREKRYHSFGHTRIVSLHEDKIKKTQKEMRYSIMKLSGVTRSIDSSIQKYSQDSKESIQTENMTSNRSEKMKTEI